MAEERSIEPEIEKLCSLWAELSEGIYSLNESGISSLRNFLIDLDEEEIAEAMRIASNKLAASDIENRYKYFCGICHNMIRQKSGDDSDEIFNKARYYFRKQGAGSGFLHEPQLRLFARRYSLEQIKEAIDVAFSHGRDNYWNAVCVALADITGDEIEI